MRGRRMITPRAISGIPTLASTAVLSNTDAVDPQSVSDRRSDMARPYPAP